MKKGTLNFLGRKNPSLFDTNIKMKDMDNVELVLGSSAIPESGTASVRARPTVKHHTPSSESFQGVAVPTPKVPLLPPVNGPKTNGSDGGVRLSNGSALSLPYVVEEDIFVPPPPSVAPPPPTGTFIPPPLDFMGDLNSLDLANLQPPSQPAPRLISRAPSMEEEDLSFLKRPTMAPPKPPSGGSSNSTSSTPISSPHPAKVPEHPKFAPPQPPLERQHKSYKTPPPKPIRLSSMGGLDSPPDTPAPPPPAHTPTLSTFNPQNTAKLYNVPQTSILSGYEEQDTRPKQMLLLEDSGTVKSVPVLVPGDAKAPKVAPLPKPVPSVVQDVKEKLQNTQPPQSPRPEPIKEANKVIIPAKKDIDKPLEKPHQTSPQLQEVDSPQMSPVVKREESPSQGRKFSPLIDRKLRNLKGSETNGTREGPATSPLALLMAAKKREKNRSTLSRENSSKEIEQPSPSIQKSDSSPNSFVVTPRLSSTSQERLQESPKSVSHQENNQIIPEKSESIALVRDLTPSSSPAVSRTAAAASPSASNRDQRLLESKVAQPHEVKELNMPLLPPPPGFDDFDDFSELTPPSILPPSPPVKRAPTPNEGPPTRVPTPPPKPKPPAAPKLPEPHVHVKPQPHVQTKPNVSSLSASQASLLSILQKKMLEMDHRITPSREAESSSDDWGSPLSDEDNKVPALPKSTPQRNSYPQTATLNMQELESRVARKYQETSSRKDTTSNGPKTKQQHGMTFTVRPGTKKPITLVSKGDSS